jgi:hypothetical protein
MRFRSKFRFRFILFFSILFIAIGFFIAYKIYNPSKVAFEPWVVPNINTPSKKFITKETIVNQFKEKEELIPLEVDLSETLTLNDSWGDLAFFKKVQNVQFSANGIYSIDLSKLTEDKITIDNKKKVINIISPNPAIKTISIDEQKTVYETPQNGALRFGEIKLTTAEYDSMLNVAKSKMSEKMLSSDLFDKALNSTQVALTNFIQSFIKAKNSENYDIKIEFEKK